MRPVLHDGPTPLGELAARLPVGRPAVSRHLRVLSNARLIEHRNAGTRNLYRLAPGAAVAVRSAQQAQPAGGTGRVAGAI